MRQYNTYPSKWIFRSRIVPDLVQSRREDEEIDEDCRYDSLTHSVFIGDSKATEGESETDIVKNRDTDTLDQKPPDDCTDGKCDSTYERCQ